jgi:hypothetical protein
LQEEARIEEAIISLRIFPAEWAAEQTYKRDNRNRSRIVIDTKQRLLDG